MYRNYKIVPFIPAGRKLTMTILMDNLYRHKDVVDQVQIWLNTDPDQVEDRAWLETLPNKYGDFVRLIERRIDRGVQIPKQLNTGGFYINTTDEDTIYFRFDDDIIYIDDDYFKNILDFRVDNPDYFLVFGNIINNATTSYYLQEQGKIPEKFGIVESDFCMDPVGWTSPYFALMLHEQMLKKIKSDKVSDMYLKDKIELDRKRFSVSNFCFFGKDFRRFDGDLMGAEEESWLTEDYPKKTGVVNVICPNALCVHFSFFAQREYLIKKNILEKYKEIAQDKLSRDYYKLLGNAK
jgi:hypothetical protein